MLCNRKVCNQIFYFCGILKYICGWCHCSWNGQVYVHEQKIETWLSKPMWRDHFALNVMSTFVLTSWLCSLKLMQEIFSLHMGFPHYVWRQKMDLVTIRLAIEFFLSLEDWWLKLFGCHKIGDFLVANFVVIFFDFWK